MFIGICCRSQVSAYRTIGPLVKQLIQTEADGLVHGHIYNTVHGVDFELMQEKNLMSGNGKPQGTGSLFHWETWQALFPSGTMDS